MRQDEKMGTMPIDQLLVSMSLPMMISMLVQALYNIVDSIFVSQISEYALRAVSLAFPIQSLMIGVAVGTGVGINSFLSKTLGERKYEKANVIAENGVFLAFLSYLFFLTLGIFLSRPFYESQTKVLEVQEYGITYLTICCVASIGFIMQITFERLLQSTGRVVLSMITQIVGAIINLVLDPILIFGYFGFPQMGVAGAAIATISGQCIAAFVGIVLHIRYNQEIRISFSHFRPDATLIAGIYKVGAPSIAMQVIGSVMSYGMNLILAVYGAAQTVFGIYFKLQSFVFMPIFGLNNGMVPIIAYNYGAGYKERVIHTIKSSVKYGVGIMLLGFVAFECFPAQIMGLFQANAELLEIGVPALRIISLSFIFAGYCIVIGSVFQAMGNGMYSMIVAAARQLCVLLPVAKLLSLSGKVDMIWYSFPIAEIVSVLVTTYFLLKLNHEVISKIGE